VNHAKPWRRKERGGSVKVLNHPKLEQEIPGRLSDEEEGPRIRKTKVAEASTGDKKIFKLAGFKEEKKTYPRGKASATRWERTRKECIKGAPSGRERYESRQKGVIYKKEKFDLRGNRGAESDTRHIRFLKHVKI